ncbi:zinc finger protein 423-like isoform X3 [Biomphalaria glabrata]|uniref:Zinc finger protein 423-like isoform X3 n=1 Tax=Biomphalaria glabrata TaxID=6526 RepID=A0A9W3AWJ7_BIOGL|nr:zinc finger protein 423-like isoform X3 [Biomphalaria glabrata]
MSRRKQARPKSCKSEELNDQDETTLLTTAAADVDITKEISESQEQLSEVPVHQPLDSDVSLSSTVNTKTGTDPIPSQADPKSVEDASKSKVMRCETCNAVFDSLDQFMDHRNFECGADLDTKGNWLLSETNSTRSASPSSQSTSSVDASTGGATDPELDSLDPKHVPFVIGVTDDNPHNCQFCEKSFAKKAYLKLHQQTHTAHMPYKCHHCPRLFRHKKSRERHEKLHSSDRKYKCQTCGVGYSRSDHLRNHIKSHDLMENDEGYKCPICQQSYMSASALTNHMKTHKQKFSSSEDHTCLECSQIFHSAEELQTHLLTHTTDQYLTNKMTTIKMERFECDICQEVFFTQGDLTSHTEQQHGQNAELKCPICFSGFTDMDLMCQHIMSHNSVNTAEVDDGGTAGIMQSILNDNSNLTKEDISMESVCSSIMSGTKSSVTPGSSSEALLCPYCLVDGFESLESLELHLTSVHSVKPTEVYTCNYCNAPYPNLYSLHDHMTVVHRSQHGLDITYPCSMCVQRFHSLDALAKHKGIVHAQQRSTGIDAAFCNRCNMTLASPGSLEEHMATVHNIIMEKHPKSFKSKGKKSSMKLLKSKDQQSSSLQVDKSLTTSSMLMSSLSAGTPDRLVTPKSNKSSPLGKHLNSESLYSNQTNMSSSITCDHCNATFHDAQNFIAHTALHSESLLNMALARNTSCDLKSSREVNDIDISGRISSQSVQSQNVGTKVNECLKCGANFSTEEQLEAHASLHYLCVSTEYGCSSCIKNFSKPDELQKHLMDIHAHHLYRCSLCKDIFDSKVNIQVHFAIKHSNECKQYKCVSCDIMFRSEMEWQVHVRVNHLHMSRPYRCLFCQESFTSEVELQCHLTTHSKQFNCPMCDQAFHIEYLLDQHMQTKHGDTKPELRNKASPSGMGINSHHSSAVSPYRNVSIKQEKEENSNPFQNPIHSSSSSSSSSCSPRIILKSPVAPSPLKQPRLVSPQTPTPSISPLSMSACMATAPVSAIWKNTEPLHMCNICDIKFCDMALLNLHKAQDHGLKSVAKPTVSERDYALKNEHEKLLLNNQTLLNALTSPPSPITLAQSPSTLTQSPLSCMFCSQTFKTSIEYNKHMKIHVNSGNLTCSICDETFSSASILAEHKLTHCKIQQGNTCVVCRLTLTNQEQFYIHSQEHGFEGSLLQCVICRQSLSSLVELQMHGRHHFQTRPSFFTCCVCLKSFESKENLVSKLNSSGRTYYVCKPCYHGEAPLHTCSQCSEKFATGQLLEAHMQTHQIQLHVTTHMLTEGTQHECRLCGALHDSPARLQTHLIQHSFIGKEIVCFVCNKMFESPQEIQVHALEHGAAFRKYACSHCSQKFFFTAELDNHKLIYNHGIVSASPSSLSSPSQLSLTSSSAAALSMATLASFLSSSPLLKSPESASSLLLQGSTKKKMEGHSMQSLGYEMLSASRNAFSSPKVQETLGMPAVSSSMMSSASVSLSSNTCTGLQCPECQKYFSTGTALANHRKTHWKKDSSNSIRCSLCSQTFNSATAMQQHFFTAHRIKEDDSKKKKNFTCVVCEKECSTLSALQNHILSHRTGGSLPCSVCKKTFTSQRYLSLHMRVHKMPDKKADKEKAADSKTTVELDIETKETKKNPDLDLLCPVCSQSFASTQEIDEHIKTHEEVFTTVGSVDKSLEEHSIEDTDVNMIDLEDR